MEHLNNNKENSLHSFVVVAIEKMQSFKKVLNKLYKSTDRTNSFIYFKNLLDKLTETCDKFNSIGLYHTNLTYKNIGIRTDNKNFLTDEETYAVILTDFVETVPMETNLYWQPTIYHHSTPVDCSEYYIPINSFYICSSWLTGMNTTKCPFNIR